MTRTTPLTTSFTAVLLGTCVLSTRSLGQVCGCGPAYTVKSQTVMVPEQETRMRVVYKTVYEDQEMTSYRQVKKQRMEDRSYTVRKPVKETSTVYERYTVMRPVQKTEWIDQSYDQTTYVTETAEREETYTTYRPVTQTQYQTQSYTVQRPVTETQYTTQLQTTYKPVTSYRTSVVDQGGYVAQQYYQPGDTRYGLRWLPSGYQATPYGGGYRRGGLGWVPYTSPGNTFARVHYQPNPVNVTIPQTSLMPQTQQVQVPVQVTRMQNEVVQQQVPVSVTTMQAYQETRKVPYSVQRPVTQHISKKVPVTKTEWVEQEMTRPKTVERTSYKLETIREQVPVTYYETEPIKTNVRVARKVPTYEQYTVTVMKPHVVQSPVTLSYVDPYSSSIASSNSWMPSERVTYGPPRPVVDNETTEQQRVLKSQAEEVPQGEKSGDSESSSDPGDTAPTLEDGEGEPANEGELEMKASDASDGNSAPEA